MSRTPEPSSFWIGGVNSFLLPSDISKQQYAWAENIVNRGGVIQTRPGYRYHSPIAGRKAQGGCLFTPKNSTARILVAVDGLIYMAKYPRYEFIQLTGIAFDPAAPVVYFEPNAIRSVERNITDNTLKLIEPTPMVMMQDGRGKAAYWDGSTARHLVVQDGETPTGTWMIWAYSRLWLIKGREVIASDIADPTSFTETTYIAERSSFALSGEGTGLIKANDEVGILAFTEKTVTAIKGYILDRTQWQLTADFVKEIITDVGCVAGRSVINQYGQTYWLSDRGLMSLDAALYAQRTTRMVTLDSAVQRSKRNLSPNRTGACAAIYENYFLLSVPSGSKYNAHTWVADKAITMDQSEASAFVGIWTGIRPVEWITGYIGGKKRLFCLAFDETARDDTNIHLWEAFQSDRKDAEHGIKCQWESMMFTSTDELRFKFATLEAVEILGDVDLQIFVGGIGGPWMNVANIHLTAEAGSIGSAFQQVLNKTSLLQAFKPQSRELKTQEFVTQGRGCHPELAQHGKGKGFQLLLEWRGRFGFREINPRFDVETSQQNKGGCTAPETGVKAVNERGEVVTS